MGIKREKRVWLVRAVPNGKNRLRDFLKHNKVLLGWGHTGDLTNESKDKVRELLVNYSGDLKGSLNVLTGVLHRFSRVVGVGDLILTPDPENMEDIYVGEVTSGYTFEMDALEREEMHTLGVQWLNDKKPVSRKHFDEKTVKTLKTNSAFATVEASEESIRGVLGGNVNDIEEKAKSILKECMDSGDEKVRLEAAKAWLSLNS